MKRLNHLSKDLQQLIYKELHILRLNELNSEFLEKTQKVFTQHDKYTVFDNTYRVRFIKFSFEFTSNIIISYHRKCMYCNYWTYRGFGPYIGRWACYMCRDLSRQILESGLVQRVSQ